MSLLKLIQLVPVLLGIGGGAVAGGAAGWFGRDLVAKNIEIPLIVKTTTERERDACTIRTMDAAGRAEAAERERQRQIREALAADADRLWAQRDAEQSLRNDQLEQEIADHEAETLAAGRSCPLDDATARWLRGEPGGDVPPAD